MATSNFVEISDGIFELNQDVISTSDIQKIPINLSELRINCKTFQFKSNLQTKFRGKSLTINTNNAEIQQSCTVDLSGNPKNPYTTDAGSDMQGNGRNGENGRPGENAGNFTLKCKKITALKGATLTIISNGANGMNGQNGGNGDDGTNGIDATDRSFIIRRCDFMLNNPVYAESREMYRLFGLNSWQDNTSQSVITTEDGLTAFIYVQTSNNEDWGLMLVKGSAGLPGNQGGQGGIGGEGGLPGNISIQCDQDDYEGIIRKISEPGRDGSNGADGSNGTNGKDGRDLWRYDLRSWIQPETFGEDKRTKFKLVWGAGDYSVCDSIKNDYVRVEEVQDAEEPLEAELEPDTEEALIIPNEIENAEIEDAEIEGAEIEGADVEGAEIDDAKIEDELIVETQRPTLIRSYITEPAIKVYLQIISWTTAFISFFNWSNYTSTDNKKDD
ncbi:hypothetical protein ACKWTF_014767 [Chironomus riparius]